MYLQCCFLSSYPIADNILPFLHFSSTTQRNSSFVYVQIRSISCLYPKALMFPKLLVPFHCSLCDQVFQKGYCSADSFWWCENDCQLWTQCVLYISVSIQVATITDPLRSIASINSLTESASCSPLKVSSIAPNPLQHC